MESTLSLLRTASKEEGKVTKEKRKLYKATIDSEEVVLKCFYVLDNLQCLQFKQEISVLKTIKYDSISRPRAIVETKDLPSYVMEPFLLSLTGQLSNSILKKSFTTECIVFVEFPFYKWNLMDWLNKEARKPWEKQSAMRQILYAVSHLHDHDIVHNVSAFLYTTLFVLVLVSSVICSWCCLFLYIQKIKPSNVFVREDDLIVLSDFESSFSCSSSLASMNMIEVDPDGGSDDGVTESSWRSSGSNSHGPDDVAFVAPEVGSAAVFY
jgi:serine/threonine protein kinase